MKRRKLLTNLSKGELSPLTEARPDLAAYFEGGSLIENWNVLRQGGAQRRVGTRFVAEVKDSTKDTILLPFETSVNEAFIVEMGNLYARFYKNKAPLGAPYEIVSPYTEAQLRNIHTAHSVDVKFMFHSAVQQRKLNHISDLNWTITVQTATPPPSFESDLDISAGGTLTPGATSGTGINFTSSTNVFLAADVGRQIIFGSSRATITSLTSGFIAVATIIDVFPDTNPIPSGSWLMRFAPQTTLDPDIKSPVGALVNLVAGAAAFRAADVGRFITIYAGLVRINGFNSSTSINAIIMSEMTGASAADPPAAPAGAWTLEIESWSATTGWPRTGAFFQGRLGQAGTLFQPVTFWLSQSDDFDSYAVGVAANNAIEYTIAGNVLNRIEWIADDIVLFLGTAGGETTAESGSVQNAPIGGDVTPLVKNVSSHGSLSIQPILVNRRLLFVDRSGLKIFDTAFDFYSNDFDCDEISGPAEHITGTGIRLGPLAYCKRPDPRIYFVRSDGQLVMLAYNYREKIIGFTRFVTDGFFEAVAVIPQAAGLPDQVWVIARRIINGATKRYVEFFETEATELVGRQWTSCQTDCAKVYALGAPTSVLTGLGHLEGKTVDVVAGASYRGTAVVIGGQITLAEPATGYAEVGLHYNSTLRTMRPAIQGEMVEGLPRNWISLWARLYRSLGGTINGVAIPYPAGKMDASRFLVGPVDVFVTGVGNPDDDGKITIVQNQPYPMTVLGLFGEIEFGDT